MNLRLQIALYIVLAGLCVFVLIYVLWDATEHADITGKGYEAVLNFDNGWTFYHNGEEIGIKQLQKQVGVPDDGVLGTQTISQIEHMNRTDIRRFDDAAE